MRRTDGCPVPVGLCPIQTFSAHIMESLWNVYKRATFLNIPAQLSLQYSDKWCGGFYGMDLRTLLGHDTSLRRIKVKKSTIYHSDAVFGFAASPTVCSDEMVGYYYVFLFYANLLKEQHETTNHGKCLTQATVETFLDWWSELPKKLVENDEIKKNVSIVSEPFCAFLYQQCEVLTGRQ